MPPEMSVSMRRSKLKADEAALLAGEVVKPSWESRNEGIHERVSFEDAIWGFDLAGGAYYRTPLRVTFVKPESRADKAGIRPGDRLLRINGIDTSTLTIQEAHDIIIKSGIHLTLTVTAPEDRFDAVYYYEDPLEEDPEEAERRRLEEEKARKRQVHAKVNHNWSLQWPWVSKRRIIWRESNCFMVPSKYEEKHRDKFPPQPSRRTTDDVVLYSAKDTSKNRVRGQKIPEQRRESQNFEMTSQNGYNQNNEDEKQRIFNGIDETDANENGYESDEYSKISDVNIDEEIVNNNEETLNSIPVEKGLNVGSSHSKREDVSTSSNEDRAVEDKLLQNEIDRNNNQFNDTNADLSTQNNDVSDFNDLLNNEVNNESTDNEIIEDVLNNNDYKDDEKNNVESIVGNGESSSEKKLE
ncbi:hypothetical protein K1T71_006926 [Dendrolimus kikuchii]|uniref:Uncharacterized protein n=1 Tax=Dendrolimus kikuchii TaxID=765133 RepID=A0ACC1D0J2_9NEOP|nr:hypothetical protein K1T71_006926 [Dendrolimus kikuchii]